MVHLDPLTKLYNRRFLTEHLDEKITRGDNEFAVALLDIDDFKKINDTYGHVYGDETLTSFAKIMMKHMEGQGIAARFGGEEFMLVFDHTDLVKIRACMDKMKEILSDHYEIVEAYDGRMALDIIDRESKTVSGVRTDEERGVLYDHQRRVWRVLAEADGGIPRGKTVVRGILREDSKIGR